MLTALSDAADIGIRLALVAGIIAGALLLARGLGWLLFRATRKPPRGGAR